MFTSYSNAYYSLARVLTETRHHGFMDNNKNKVYKNDLTLYPKSKGITAFVNLLKETLILSVRQQTSSRPLDLLYLSTLRMDQFATTVLRGEAACCDNNAGFSGFL